MFIVEYELRGEKHYLMTDRKETALQVQDCVLITHRIPVEVYQGKVLIKRAGDNAQSGD